jgi:hypothetical protein
MYWLWNIYRYWFIVSNTKPPKFKNSADYVRISQASIGYYNHKMLLQTLIKCTGVFFNSYCHKMLRKYNYINITDCLCHQPWLEFTLTAIWVNTGQTHEMSIHDKLHVEAYNTGRLFDLYSVSLPWLMLVIYFMTGLSQNIAKLEHSGLFRGIFKIVKQKFVWLFFYKY